MSKNENHHRPDLIGEHRFGDAGQLISFIIFTLVWVGDSFVFRKTTFLNEIVPLYVRLPLAVVALSVSVYLVRKSMSIIFGEKRETPAVVRKDIYGKIRHPMYVSEILMYFGLLCLNISLAAAGVFVLVIIFLFGICRYEEKLLLDHFGDDYRNYMKDVPMWIPRLWKKQKTNPNNQ